MNASLVMVAPDTSSIVALCACSVSLFRMGTACSSINVDRLFSGDVAIETPVIFLFFTVMVACTGPQRMSTAGPLYLYVFAGLVAAVDVCGSAHVLLAGSAVTMVIMATGSDRRMDVRFISGPFLARVQTVRCECIVAARPRAVRFV